MVFSKSIRHFDLPFLLFAFSCLGEAQVSSTKIPEFRESCVLQYAVTARLRSQSGVVKHGDFILINTQKALYYRLNLGGQDGFSMVSTKGRIYVSQGNSRANCRDGFCLDAMPLVLLLPYNFPAASPFTVLEQVPELNTVDRKRSLEREGGHWNVGLLISQLKGERAFAAGELIQRDDSSGRFVELRLGLPLAGKSRYSGFRTLGDRQVPGEILLSSFRMVPVNGTLVPKVDADFELKLTSAKLGVPASEVPTVSTVVKDGMTVTYDGDQGQATVLYHASNGSFEDQLGRQLSVISEVQAGKAHVSGTVPPPVNIPVYKDKRFPWLPLGLTMGFGGIAGWIVLRNRRNVGSP